MQVKRCENSTNFGHKYTIHKLVSGHEIKKFHKLSNKASAIEKYVQRPDFDEVGFGNNHFYFQPTLFQPRESFLDFSGLNNALAKFNIHISEVEPKEPLNSFSAEHVGRALHFLQDITQPQHTQRGNFMQKLLDRRLHRAFENFEAQNIYKYLANYNGSGADFNGETFEDLFMHHVKKSQEALPALRTNYRFWDEIAQKSVNNLVDATNEFFTLLSSFIK